MTTKTDYKKLLNGQVKPAEKDENRRAQETRIDEGIVEVEEHHAQVRGIRPAEAVHRAQDEGQVKDILALEGVLEDIPVPEVLEGILVLEGVLVGILGAAAVHIPVLDEARRSGILEEGRLAHQEGAWACLVAAEGLRDHLEGARILHAKAVPVVPVLTPDRDHAEIRASGGHLARPEGEALSRRESVQVRSSLLL